jgi:hypothetical protein
VFDPEADCPVVFGDRDSAFTCTAPSGGAGACQLEL